MSSCSVRNVSSHGVVKIEDPKSSRTFKINGQFLKPLSKFQAIDEEETIHQSRYLEWVNKLCILYKFLFP